MGISKQNIAVLTPTLHLIYMALSFVKHSESNETLKKEIAQTLISILGKDSSFVECLKELYNNNQDYKEYHNCIKNIFGLMDFFPENINSLLPKDSIHDEESSKLDKKAQARLRMEHL